MAALPLFSQAELSELDNQRRTQYQPAWISRTGPPTEYSPSEPTIELVNLQTSRTSIDITTTFLIGAGGPTPWHPKLTLYRLLVILSTVGVGVAKEVTSYLNLTYASITLEWILGVVLFLVLYILGIFELTYTRRLAWFFEFDYLDYWWKFLYQFAGTHRPSYTSDENNTGDDFSDHPPMTGYRLLITSTVFGVGITKSVLVYGNRQTEATTVECVIGIFVATGLYWLGLYEASSTKVYPAFFHIDYSPGITYLLTTGSNIAWFSLHLIGMALAAGLTCAFSFLVLLHECTHTRFRHRSQMHIHARRKSLQALGAIPCLAHWSVSGQISGSGHIQRDSRKVLASGFLISSKRAVFLSEEGFN
ncbi:hypothetical protein M413DRAFT_168201 [Hebeloma cylindrosporum]|uniref:Uncharacterized protein n=1 Tax=Hebeloma cylindrosporum TaxID=76867 RepID=A0A0C3CB20_HEBCY|nr:hypothetical protein M413DRAFT_168201 [Hebeloma cylindrosporum h7]